MKNNDQDFKADLAETQIPEDMRFTDNRIYPIPSHWQLILQGICLIYPVMYEIAQLRKTGVCNYVCTNYKDWIHIVFGYLNIYMQLTQGTWSLQSKVVIILVIFATMFRTFESLRVIQSYSYIVTMIREVMYDLRVFLTFYVILILSCTMVLDVIGRTQAPEYSTIGPLFGNLFSMLRLSLGDFEFSQIDTNPLITMHTVFWIVWVLMVAFSSLIFLNFIIAEVSNSYARCREAIEANIFKERAMLIAEAEDLIASQKKTNVLSFPKYIVSRKKE